MSRVAIRVPLPHAARIVIACVSIAGFASGCGYGTGTAGDNVDGSTPSESFHQDLDSYPQGKTLYWVGPRTAGFRLAQATDPATGNGPDVTLTYVSEHQQLVHITTFLGREAPLPNTVPPTNGIVMDTVMTASGQLVGFKISRDFGGPSTAALAKLEAALRPVTSADIDRLPADWEDIP